jgi:hypothetical protein
MIRQNTDIMVINYFAPEKKENISIGNLDGESHCQERKINVLGFIFLPSMRLILKFVLIWGI